MKLTNKERLFQALRGESAIIAIDTKDERYVLSMLKEFVATHKETYSLYSWDGYLRTRNEITNKRVTVNIEVDGKKEERYQSLSSFIKKQVLNIRNHSIGVCRVDPFKEDKEFEKLAKHIAYDMMFPFTKEYHLPYYDTKQNHKMHVIFLLDEDVKVPASIKHLVHYVHFELPSYNEIKQMVESFITEKQLVIEKEEVEKIIYAAKGLTEFEFMEAVKQSFYVNGTIQSKVIHQYKIDRMKQTGLLEYIENDIRFENVGGFQNLKKWITNRKHLLKDEVRSAYNLPFPKGVLLTGVQGCGKSLSVKGIASELDMPLFRLNLGNLMDKWVGGSEKKLNQTIELIETLSPCVLWMDEIEKFLSTNDNSHEVIKRMLGTLLTWLQEKTSPVFVAATANNVDQMPPELMRKGRFDEMYFIDLPSAEERMNIIQIHTKKHCVTLEDAEVRELAKVTFGFSGAELEFLIQEGIVHAISESVEPNQALFIKEAKKITPLSVIMKEKIGNIRKWAMENQLRFASNEENGIHAKKIGFLNTSENE